MLLPLSIWRAFHDPKGRKTLQWIVVALFAVANAITVSRSGLISIVIALAITVMFVPRTAKMWAAVIVPVGTAAMFVGVPGLIGTMFSTTTAGSSDTSITYRTEDYPLALRLVTDRPLFGTGPGTWIPAQPKDIFDNEYLLVAVTMGVIGLIAMIAYLAVPAIAALAAARHAQDKELKLLGASVAAAGLIATVASGTFDSMSFPVFALLCPFFTGLSGATWLMVKNQLDPVRNASLGAASGKVPWG
ncbi:O-Antigen ligase [compost metagenome]